MLNQYPHHPHQAKPLVLSVQDAVFPVHPFSGVLAIGRERDWQLNAMFPALGLDAEGAPAGDVRISYRQARESLLQARHLGGADLGILSGARKSLPQLGAMATGMLAQETLYKAMEFGLEYQLIAGAMVQLVLEPGAQFSALSARPLFDDVELQDFLDADHLATAINASRALCGRNPGGRLQLERVELRGNRQASRSVGEDFFACPVIYGADVSRIIVRNSVLDTLLQEPDPELAVATKQVCDTELATVGLSGKQSLLHKLVSLQCDSRSVQELAQALGISPRSLHRLLAREGCSYFQIAESLRMERARHYLRHTSMSLDEIAGQLQYSDSRSFRRAFKRASQLSPSEFRKQALLSA
ncbi:helix-turn-helix domain-containing protein [Undibacterium sp. CY18W]|uniref:Helix-turn-helix domain-containing protein n=1 Tax=Undibacterium hunanense TaxID=2762292 RepID=A0ABR6ZL43_9BURK|nr:AraC family transcriptional regulator [Undibacterium hunanense]MBC3916623.1 helix-turn-helix domain-containing protein [Undibacterium hunanense]